VAIIFKDLQKLVSQQQKENTRKELFERATRQTTLDIEQAAA
jgi:hypothetical protein